VQITERLNCAWKTAGIDEHLMHQAMQPFHRLDNVGEVPGPGSGWRWPVILPGCTAATFSLRAVKPWGPECENAVFTADVKTGKYQIVTI
jgi:hypothetical protein